MDKYYTVNRAHWDESASVHVSSKTGAYRNDDFRAGIDIMLPIEATELGSVVGKHVIHLQCHFGLDTLNLARRGAKVTGIDFSPVAIKAARALSVETGVPGDFVECNLYDAPDHVQGQFDIAYVTWGAITWLPDIRGWAKVVAHFLRPGGTLYLLEGHPAAYALEQVDGNLVPTYPYFQGDTPIAFEEDNSYSGDQYIFENKLCYCWTHSLSAIISALSEAGLQLGFFHEHEHIPWKLFPMMIEASEGMFKLPDHISNFPLAFSLKATKL